MDRKRFCQLAGSAVLLTAATSLFPHKKILKYAYCKPVKSSDFKFSYEKYRLNLQHTWTTSGSSSDFRDIVIVKIEKDGVTGIGEAAPSKRYNETADSVLSFIKKSESLISQSDLWQFHELNENLNL